MKATEKQKERFKIYYLNHKKEFQLYWRNYYLENKEKLKQKYKEKYYQNRKKILERQKKWNKKNWANGRIKKKQNLWKKENLDKVKYNSYKSQAKKDKREWNLTLEEFKKFWQKPCFYCGSEIKTIGIDRVNNSNGYIKENCISCCKICNRAKSDMSKEEFLNHCKKIVEYQNV